MTDTTNNSPDMARLYTAWLDTAAQFWQTIGAHSPGVSSQPPPFSFDFSHAAPAAGEEKYRTYRSWETSFNNFLAFMRLLGAPENQEALNKGVSSLAEAFVQATGESFEHFTELQAQLVNSFAKASEHTKAYNFDELDHGAFESMREWYRSEFQKYMKIPKIGLPREFHERVSQLFDKSNIYNSHLLELMYLFYLPFEKTNLVMQEKTKEMLERGEFVDDYKKLYGEWVKVLEGHYMELLKSPEYTQVMNNFIQSLAEYKTVKQDVTDVFIKDLKIPTSREMDELYRDLHELKKKVRILSRQVETLKQQQALPDAG
ncbi:MAG: hypothetical protein N839_0003305 [Desulfofustis sp. PB-SRB1]|jgi:class III poly(R)-hydroxyalkanoic acid synthase PhaE subunit|nr:hypothetical protein [Desulfofustis sp. PB-SRB1]MBM1001419.1 hypothetical protein [Desulfofustis sp. PB-SRB1]HBH29261.1 hypothetical protein [Desulfofustis sp.]